MFRKWPGNNFGKPQIHHKIESEDPATRLAVLIDVDNAQAAIIEGLLAEIARFGEATVKRIYGDFTSSRSASWNKVLQKHRGESAGWANSEGVICTGEGVTEPDPILDQKKGSDPGHCPDCIG